MFIRALVVCGALLAPGVSAAEGGLLAEIEEQVDAIDPDELQAFAEESVEDAHRIVKKLKRKAESHKPSLEKLVRKVDREVNEAIEEMAADVQRGGK